MDQANCGRPVLWAADVHVCPIESEIVGMRQTVRSAVHGTESYSTVSAGTRGFTNHPISRLDNRVDYSYIQVR
jgi:hypothetical protein